MTWVMRALLGPTLWLVAFAAIYSLHGYGCAQGWQLVPMSFTSLHRVVLLGSWIAALLLMAALLLEGRRRPAEIRVQTGDAIGLGATFLTLWPTAGISSCF